MRDVRNLSGEIEMSAKEMEIAKKLLEYVQTKLGKLKGVELTEDFIENEVRYDRLTVMRSFNEIWYDDELTVNVAINLDTLEIRNILK